MSMDADIREEESKSIPLHTRHLAKRCLDISGASHNITPARTRSLSLAVECPQRLSMVFIQFVRL